jgi:hypothetical protein
LRMIAYARAIAKPVISTDTRLLADLHPDFRQDFVVPALLECCLPGARSAAFSRLPKGSVYAPALCYAIWEAWDVSFNGERIRVLDIDTPRVSSRDARRNWSWRLRPKRGCVNCSTRADPPRAMVVIAMAALLRAYSRAAGTSARCSSPKAMRCLTAREARRTLRG